MIHSSWLGGAVLGLMLLAAGSAFAAEDLLYETPQEEFETPQQKAQPSARGALGTIVMVPPSERNSRRGLAIADTPYSSSRFACGLGSGGFEGISPGL